MRNRIYQENGIPPPTMSLENSPGSSDSSSLSGNAALRRPFNVDDFTEFV